MIETLRLFKAVQIIPFMDNKVDFARVMRQTLPHGFIFAPDVLQKSSEDISMLIKEVRSLYGRNSQELNQGFHKSFEKVRTATRQQLVYEQVLHYLTTYGSMRAGFYDSEMVYIPYEDLNVPELTTNIPLVVIHGLTYHEITQKLLQLLQSGIALAEQTVQDCLVVAKYVKLLRADVETIKNREVKIALYDHFGYVPSDPVEFLRYVVYVATQETLLIKNRKLITALNQSTKILDTYFDTYAKTTGLSKLGQIFYRYKPIFLAMRTTPKMRKTINQIRRLAVTNHVPMPVDYLNSITAQLTTGVDMKKFLQALNGATTFRKIRLAYALKFRTTGSQSIVYRVRNGKSWATSLTIPSRTKYVENLYNVVVQSICDDLKKNVENKTIYIPAGVNYGVPATEKQFTGNIPVGTYVETTDDLVCGVYWKNGDQHTDLDLSLLSIDGKIGWDRHYRDDHNGIYFSGDMTDATHGASEVFHVSNKANGTWLMMVTYYNHSSYSASEAPFRTFVGQENKNNLIRKYLINPNNLLAYSESEVGSKQKTLGILTATNKGYGLQSSLPGNLRFYFAETMLDASRTSSVNGVTEHVREYFEKYYTNSLNLNDLLSAAGAIFVDNPEDAEINLSMEALDKLSIITLFTDSKLSLDKQ